MLSKSLDSGFLLFFLSPPYRPVLTLTLPVLRLIYLIFLIFETVPHLVASHSPPSRLGLLVASIAHMPRCTELPTCNAQQIHQ